MNFLSLVIPEQGTSIWGVIADVGISGVVLVEEEISDSRGCVADNSLGSVDGNSIAVERITEVVSREESNGKDGETSGASVNFLCLIIWFSNFPFVLAFFRFGMLFLKFYFNIDSRFFCTLASTKKK